MKSATTCLLALISTSGCARESATTAEWSSALSGGPCAAEARRELLGRGARGETFPWVPPPGVAARHRIPTDTLGVWLLLDVVEGAPPTIWTIQASAARRVTFDAACAPGPARVPDPAPSGVGAPPPDAFTDRDLIAALGAPARVPDASTPEPGVVVYVWSPHMPLSVDGYAQIDAAAAELGLRLEPVLAPGSDVRFATAEAARAGLPERALRPAASVELTMRDALVHAPAVIAFQARRASAVLPGYRDAGSYRSWLERFLAEGAADAR